MIWPFVLGFALYFLVFRSAAEAWNRRLRGPGSKSAGCGLTGNEVARALLEKFPEPRPVITRGRAHELARHDPRGRKLVLGPSVYDGKTIAATSLAALAVAEATCPEEDQPALAKRRSITRVLHPTVGVLIAAGMVMMIFRPTLWKPLLSVWLLSGVILLLGNAGTLAVEYKLAARAMRLLESVGFIRRGEEADFDQMRKGLPLREMRGVGSAVARVFRALLPVKGWR
ncbi:MAG: zinc metallopeptidase [Verrucomicrobiales bacterium]